MNIFSRNGLGMVGMCGVNRYLSDPDMVAAQLVEQEYLQALGKVQYKKK